MVTIEHYFNEVINVPEQITLEDVRLIRYVATLLQGKEVRNHWRKYETTMTIASHTKQNMAAAGTAQPLLLTAALNVILVALGAGCGDWLHKRFPGAFARQLTESK